MGLARRTGRGPLRDRLRGVIGFPVTPMAPDGSIDGEGLVRNLRAMLAQPLGGIVAPGGSGELYSLTPEEHRLVVRAAVAAARGRVPVIAAAGVSVRLGAELARQAEAEGAVDGRRNKPRRAEQVSETIRAWMDDQQQRQKAAGTQLPIVAGPVTPGDSNFP